jgi:hypothetical protein
MAFSGILEQFSKNCILEQKTSQNPCGTENSSGVKQLGIT